MTHYYAPDTCKVVPRAGVRRAVDDGAAVRYLRRNCTHQRTADGRTVCEEVRPSMIRYDVTPSLGPGVVTCTRCWNVAGHTRV
jgi:hypothetical protein